MVPALLAVQQAGSTIAIRAGTEVLERVEFVMNDGIVFKQDGQVVGRSAAGIN